MEKRSGSVDRFAGIAYKTIMGVSIKKGCFHGSKKRPGGKNLVAGFKLYLAGYILFLLLFLLHLFHEHAVTLAIHDRPVTVLAKVFCNIIPVQVEGEHHKPLTERLCHDEQDQYGNYQEFHY
jgi:hypothetical protein